MYVLDAWTLSKRNENILVMREGTILRRIFGPVKEHFVWRIHAKSRADESVQRTRYYLKTTKKED